MELQRIFNKTNLSVHDGEFRINGENFSHATFSAEEEIRAKGPTPCLLFILILLSKEVTNEDYVCENGAARILVPHFSEMFTAIINIYVTVNLLRFVFNKHYILLRVSTSKLS